MRRPLFLGILVFCIKVSFISFFATTYLLGIVKKYNAELRASLNTGLVVDPSWNPNALLVKGWAPMPPPLSLPAYPGSLRGNMTLHRELLREFDDQAELKLSLPIQSAPVDLPIRPFGSE
ncbi:hypothetical protein [Comamonas sp. w2-DMI]|uniref:hypothetical protein n=1 Tax=Comamonas sp. w2-DMI TaxID=3126391 RepID=UPI0032E52097